METIFVVLLTVLGTITAIVLLGILVRSLRISKGRRARNVGMNPGRQAGMRNRRLMAMPLSHENHMEFNLLE